MRFRVIDIETTGLAPPAEIIEIGFVDVIIDQGAIEIELPQSQLYRPLHGISPETMAVHHITEKDFQPNTPVCTFDELVAAILAKPAPDALVAHNCEFERQFISDAVTGGLPWICTHKISLRVWPEAPRHSNQVLRYWRNLTLDAALAMPLIGQLLTHGSQLISLRKWLNLHRLQRCWSGRLSQSSFALYHLESIEDRRGPKFRPTICTG